ncbi:unnamed protein product [Camellia sinensis]
MKMVRMAFHSVGLYALTLIIGIVAKFAFLRRHDDHVIFNNHLFAAALEALPLFSIIFSIKWLTTLQNPILQDMKFTETVMSRAFVKSFVDYYARYGIFLPCVTRVFNGEANAAVLIVALMGILLVGLTGAYRRFDALAMQEDEELKKRKLELEMERTLEMENKTNKVML